MATFMDEFTIDAVKDFMVSRGGRVTNHQLVNQFKPYLTNPAGKEWARNKFKQYVNTLANISNEGGEKYLVLKRKYRVGTPLDENYVPPPQSPAATTPTFTSPSQFNTYGSPQHGSPFSPTISTPSPPVPPLPARATPPYRAPPPYRPPPPATPTHQGYMPPDDMARRYDPSPQHLNGRSDPRYHGDMPRYPPVSEQRFSEARYPPHEPADLGIPPPPQTMRSASSLSSLSSGISYGGSSAPQSPGATYGGYNNVPALTPLSASRPRSLSLHQMSSTSEDGDSLSVSATTVSSTSTPSSEEPPPPVPPRRRQTDNKENLRPAPDGEEGAKTGVGGDGSSEDTSGEVNDDERKISVSVKEQTQKFNKLASESQLPNASSRGSSKSNRSSRSDRDDDDSTSILSYGPEGQEWKVAVAKSDFNEILRLLKIHPSLARHKDIANGYTALHWAAKHGRSEVVKLLAGTHHVEINARSNGGYTPLHIAAMYNRTEVFDLLVHYGADLNLRDYSGKKPLTYSTVASTVSQDTQRSKYDSVDRMERHRSLTGTVSMDSGQGEDPKDSNSHLSSSRFDRAKRVGSKRFQRIKKSLTFSSYDRASKSPMRVRRPLSEAFREEEELQQHKREEEKAKKEEEKEEKEKKKEEEEEEKEEEEEEKKEKEEEK